MKLKKINNKFNNIKRNEEPIKIIALLESKFRLIYQACNLQKKGYSEDEISSLLNVHKYPVHLAINAGYKYSDELLLKYMLELSELDSDIKSGIKDSSLALELFLLKI